MGTASQLCVTKCRKKRDPLSKISRVTPWVCARFGGGDSGSRDDTHGFDPKQPHFAKVPKAPGKAVQVDDTRLTPACRKRSRFNSLKVTSAFKPLVPTIKLRRPYAMCCLCTSPGRAEANTVEAVVSGR